jgi:hypothetical protein
MKIDEMISVLQAAKANRPIQYKRKRCGEWTDCGPYSGIVDSEQWDFTSTDYRIKPDPREI